jgi:tartrate-resistant acid phosphatase type 5
MPEYHAEPYIYLPAVTHKSALIAWGAFYFRVTSKGSWKLVDDDDLKYVHPPRRDSIGARSAPYGPAYVEVCDARGTCVASAKTEASNHCWIAGLQPDTEYTYKVIVKGQEWAEGERWDWSAADMALCQRGGRYDNRFRTHPDPRAPAPLTFAAIGDFGVGVKRSSATRRQQQVADSLHGAVDTEGVRLLLTTGDNIYAARKLFGIPIGSTGDEDDDWFFTYFQPYRYVVNRLPVYPSIGNHDADETEGCDDRAQVEDNFYLAERLAGEEAGGRASFGPGLFYKFAYGSDIEFVCIDTSKEAFFRGHRLFELPKHWEFIESAFPAAAPGAPRWRIPFAHHPPFSAGPQHYNTRSMQRLLPLFQRAGVRVMLSGHEHNFQHSSADGIDYFVTGAAGQARTGTPDRFDEARTTSWSADCHFLLVKVDGDRMVVRAIGESAGGAEPLVDIPRRSPAGEELTGPMIVQRGGDAPP